MGTKKRKPLAHGRPPLARQQKAMSRRTARAIISSHHSLEKRRAKAVNTQDQAELENIEHGISTLRGLEAYQLASLQGQRADRGGDASKTLMAWLKDVLPAFESIPDKAIRMLEIGALSTTNACSQHRQVHVERIDLHSQEPGILQQDFMERQLPRNDSEKFDILSLSLVLNYLSEPAARGRMLRRTIEFLREPIGPYLNPPTTVFPCLFLVLPTPCISNSRYLDGSLLKVMMESLGYVEVQGKATSKLVYSLYRWRGTSITDRTFSKKQIHTGRTRNNFAIVLQEQPI